MSATRIIKVFLASSIKELKDERLNIAELGNEIGILFRQDNIAIQIMKCESMHFGNIGDDDQKAIDEMLRECEMSLFLFKTKAGDWTAHEFEVARALQKEKLHRVFVYFINPSGEKKRKNSSLEKFKTQLESEHIFWKEYDDVLEVKFSFAMGMLNHVGITANEGTKESKKIAKDGDSRFALLEENEQQNAKLKKDLCKDIEDLMAQKDRILSDDTQLISSRIILAKALFEKADRWASKAYDKEKCADLLFGYAQFLYKYGLYKDSETIWLQQIPLVEELHGKESRDVATSYNEIGLAYDDMGDYDKALRYYFKALAIREKFLSKEHPDTATSYNNIGGVYWNQGNYDKALEYHFKALVIREKFLGKEHPDTATSYNNIGLVYNDQGNYGEALGYHSKALAIDEKVLGKDHSSTATDYHNIGLVYYEKGDRPKALDYLNKAYRIVEKVLGPNHPKTIQVLDNIQAVKGAMRFLSR